MANIIELREKLTFGKHRGRTGQELLKSKEGADYLVWVYKNTDIQIDAFIVDMLVNAGLVKRKFTRRNSKAGGGSDGEDTTMKVLPGGNLAEIMKGVPTINGLIGKEVKVSVHPTFASQFKTIDEVLRGRKECEKLRQMLLEDDYPSVEEQFRRRVQLEIKQLNKDIDLS